MKGLAKDLCRLVDRNRVRIEPEDLYSYACDATHYFAFRTPDAVVLPENTKEVSGVLKYANERVIPVTPRGAGSGLSAGCTPIKGGIVMDMKRMRDIVSINRGNMTARVEAGVVLDNFHRRVEKEKLFYPPDPQSMEVCTIGGNVATRAGGPHGVKYGTTGNYVLGLEVVLPDGEIINTGGNCVKQSSGYDLTHLLTGSEGTLGVITGINLRLLPLPPTRKTVVVVCDSVDLAANLVSEIIASSVIPAKLEFLHKGAVILMNIYIPKPLPIEGEAYLLIELDGSTAQVEQDARQVEDICVKMKAMEIRVVQDEKDAESYWEARKNLNPVLLAVFKKMINEDVTVPRDRIPELIRAIQEISASVGVNIGLGGHAGDGNMHPVVLMPQISDELDAKADKAIRLIIKKGLELGGTVSGEHGIGLHKAEFLAWEFGEAQVRLMKRLKLAFDPRGIMNPGKIWTDGGAA